MYYEIHGPTNPGQLPLVLLHGGGDTIETSFGHLLPALAPNRRIIVFEQQGSGRTADIEDRWDGTHGDSVADQSPRADDREVSG
jgi:pimeloyl-ACP methyl ester carboxylesterase